ncbi:MAG: hypothetical protein H7645_11760 [Candidatus Heimdallarchaeota archaeon]|nr:hypothetical protein [Candidatus Heimdallarchaeota archaeon]MCK4770998.1 hypothetical protein [Candidatus Heimdallarchaeota archaeon]
MGTITRLTWSFFLSLSLVGVSIYYFIEGDNQMGRLFVFLAIFAFLSFFYIFRSMYYLKHKATFNEFIFVFVLPMIPALILLAQKLFGIDAMFILSTGELTTSFIDYEFYINAVDLMLLPYYLASNFLLFRTFVRYPFIRFRGTSEKGIPPKLSGFLLMMLIPALNIISSLLYFNNLFLLVFGMIYFYLGTIALFV